MKNLAKAYYYGLALMIIGIIILAFVATNLIVWFLFTCLVSMVNYLILIRIKTYENVSQAAVLGTLLVRWLIIIGVIVLIYFVNRKSESFTYIMIVAAIGLPVMNFSAMISSLIHKKGAN